MILAAIVLGFGGAWWIEEMVEGVNDRILAAASRAIADSLTVVDGKIQLELSPAIFGMMENNARDNVFYSVTHRGKVLSGYDDLPSITPTNLGDTQVIFGNGTYLDRPIRIVAEGRSLPQIDSPVVIQVAETLDARERVSYQMLTGLLVLEFTLIALAAAFITIAVRWGLRPLDALRNDMDSRAAADLAPLPLEAVPVELHSLVKSFNSILLRLDAAIVGIRRFTADASHQLRTPLTVIRTHLTNYRRVDPRSPDAAAAIQDIDQASERLSNLLVQLLALARADAAAPTTVELTRLDLHSIAEAVVSDFALPAIRADVELSIAGSSGKVFAKVNKAIAVELVGNLVDNAILYAGRGSKVEVSAALINGRPTLIVEDDGPGIPKKDRARAMVRFGRVGKASESSGSGLGLNIAAGLAEAIGGELSLATAKSGRGLRVEIIFGERGSR
ncbi:MAG: sensor histidine kinase [Sphingomonas sp.]|uniref:sensor histidine kinase n=1 Tax=Sphingomonas sp. TaxID=28214 RepID=UPI0026079A8E|nr:sensor histidine kinase [Sphingomonas sp.]MDK2766934.1 sensor histidine kinase [Sphingomonas sp.]